MKNNKEENLNGIKADVKCCFCVHFENGTFDNKRFGYCKKLFHEIYTEDKEGNILNDEKVVTNVDFGCVQFERKNCT